jgi:hypothetical protein
VSLRRPRPVSTAHLFTPLHEDLLRVLKPLKPRDWARRVDTGVWRVRDVAAHLLDGDLRRLSFQRDDHPPPEPDQPLKGYGELVEWLNELNASWIRAMDRLSPGVLLELLEATGPRVGELFESLDPEAPALFPVAWAGEARSRNWMDLGREFVERWHHQQQIRDAVGAPPLTAPWMLGPLLAVCVHSLPMAYARHDLPAGTRIQLEVPEKHGGSWVVERGRRAGNGPKGAWRLREGSVDHPDVRIRVEPALAWRVFLRGVPEDQILSGMEVEGQEELAAPLLSARALMV